MDGNWGYEGRGSMNYKMVEDEDEDEEEEEEEEEEEDDGRKKRPAVATDIYSRRSGSKAAGGSVPPACQVDGCAVDMSNAKQYHKRHKVCEYHAKAPAVLISQLQQRFCQQCSRISYFSGSMSYQNLMSQKGVAEGV